MDEVVTVVVIDDHDVVIDGVKSWCAAADPPLQVVAAGARPVEAWTGPGATAAVVILDLQLGNAGVAEFGELRRLAQAGRSVVVHTQDTERTTAVRCLHLGAATFVTKAEGREHLVAAVRAAARGQRYTPPSLSGSILADDDPSRPALSPMEREALRAWFMCASKDMAAEMLNIKPKTLDGYIQRARRKYDAVGRPGRSKAVLIRLGMEDGFISMDEIQ